MGYIVEELFDRYKNCISLLYLCKKIYCETSTYDLVAEVSNSSK